MFLRNKHTGEVIEWEKNITYKVGKTYTSLKELQEDWEDANLSIEDRLNLLEKRVAGLEKW